MAIDERVGTLPPGAAGQPDFSVGKVISQTFGAVGKNFAVFAPLALVAAIPNTAVLAISAAERNGMIKKEGGGVTQALIAMAISFVVSIVFSYLLSAAVTHGTFKTMNGERATFAECLGTSISSLFPLLGVGLLASLGIALGFLLLVVPGIIFTTMWFVAVPVLIVEHTGVMESFRRSSEITDGYRWSLFGLIAIGFVVGLIVSVIGRIIGSAVAGQSLLNLWPYVAIEYLVRTAMMLLFAAGTAVAYYELRVVKEGIGPEAVASVFD